MTAAEAMEALDAVEATRSEDARYIAALTLYEAVRAGLIEVPVSQTTLYRWMLKWATLPAARGRRISPA